MKNHQEAPLDSRMNIGVGAAIGLILGGAAAEIVSDSTLAGLVGMFLGAGIGALLGSRVTHQVHWMEFPKGVVRRLILSGALFIIVLTVSLLYIGDDLERTTQLIVSLVPLVPGLLFLASVADAISKLDELQRRIQIEAIAVGFGISIFAMMTIGMLSYADVAQPNGLVVAGIMVLSWSVGKLWARWKYR
jgi:large-conductance mechanosensitive channel